MGYKSLRGKKERYMGNRKQFIVITVWGFFDLQRVSSLPILIRWTTFSTAKIRKTSLIL